MPTRRSSAFTLAGLRRSSRCSTGMWRSTRSSRSAASVSASAASTGRGPMNSAISASATARSIGSPSCSSSAHSDSAADSEWTVPMIGASGRASRRARPPAGAGSTRRPAGPMRTTRSGVACHPPANHSGAQVARRVDGFVLVDRLGRGAEQVRRRRGRLGCRRAVEVVAVSPRSPRVSCASPRRACDGPRRGPTSAPGGRRSRRAGAACPPATTPSVARRRARCGRSFRRPPASRSRSARNRSACRDRRRERSPRRRLRPIGDARADGSSPAEFVEPIVVDPGGVRHLVDHRDEHLLGQLVEVVARVAQRQPVDRDDVGPFDAAAVGVRARPGTARAASVPRGCVRAPAPRRCRARDRVRAAGRRAPR